MLELKIDDSESSRRLEPVFASRRVSEQIEIDFGIEMFEVVEAEKAVEFVVEAGLREFVG